MLSHKELKKLHDKAYNHGYDTRQKAADDMVFAWVTQWDDTCLSESDLAYRGEFNILRKAMRQIITDLKLNPVQVDFEPVDETDDDAADLMDGMYRANTRNNSALEAKNNASQEAIVCGVGAWRWTSEYVNDIEGDERQKPCRKPIYEANNTVFFDPNAKLIDKSDAKYCSVLTAYTEDGYKELKEDLGVDEYEDSCSSFAEPEVSYVFPWTSQNNLIYVSEFYQRTRKKVKYIRFTDDFGGVREMRESDITPEIEDELVDYGFSVDSEKEVTRYVVTLYIASGQGILKSYDIAGEHIPVVPQYGERQFIEGEECYEGITRLAKDPQRLRNFQLSYLADMVSRSGREKPIYTQEQIAGYENMYEISGVENNYPYLLQNYLDSSGNPLPIGPVGYSKAPDMPSALMQSIAESRQAVDDVASPGLPQDITDTDLSGKAVQQLQKRLDMQSYTYQDNHKFAVRRDGEIYASMVRDLVDVEQDIMVVGFDGSKRKETVNKANIDFTTMDSTIENDIKKMSFDVYADIGPAFESVKAQNKEELKELINGMPPGTPIYNMLLNKYLMMMDGTNFKDVRDYARKQNIMMGVQEPETDEEKIMVKQAQENQQPDASMVLAQAEMQKAQADMMGEQNKQVELQLKAADAQAKHLGTKEKLQSETALNAAKVKQGQQKLNQDFALNLAKLELEANRDMNAQVQDNLRLRQGLTSP